MANTGGVDTDNVGSPGGLGVSAQGSVLLDALGLVVVVAKDTGLNKVSSSPLFHKEKVT